MAQRTIIELLDDLDGESEAAETVTFALDGTHYEIDLSEKNASRLRESVLEWSQHARKVGGRTGTRRSSTPALRQPASTENEDDPNSIREWAKSAGYEVSGRGRIAQKVREAYRRAVG